jgi:putative holliday junction resolvase
MTFITSFIFLLIVYLTINAPAINNYLLSIIFVQEEETTNSTDFTDVFRAPAKGRLVGLDIGTKRLGVAVSDELQFTVRPLYTLKRTGWKKLLLQIKDILAEFDAQALVLGLPYNFDGSESEMSREARRLARNFSLSLTIPVILQDERVSSIAARENLHNMGFNLKEIRRRVDAEAAAIILSDFFERRSEMLKKKQEKE